MSKEDLAVLVFFLASIGLGLLFGWLAFRVVP